MSYYCSYYSQNCSQQCCDVSGYCPYYQSDCYYYYNGSIGYNYNYSSTYSTSSTVPVGMIIGISVGSFFFCVILCTGIIWACIRARKQSITNATFASATPMGYNNPNVSGGTYAVPAPVYQNNLNATPYGQPYYGAPATMNPVYIPQDPIYAGGQQPIMNPYGMNNNSYGM